MSAPRKLAISKFSPAYNAEAIKAVDKVFVDGIHVPNCVAYDMDGGWAFGKGPRGEWLPRLYGSVTVTMKVPA